MSEEEKSRKEKLNVIREYLNTKFPGYDIAYAIANQRDFDTRAQTFILTKDKVINLVTIEYIFLDDHNASEIWSLISKSNLSQYFLKQNVTRVIFTNSGIKTEKRLPNNGNT